MRARRVHEPRELRAPEHLRHLVAARARRAQERVAAQVAPRHSAGRLKQWLNLLRRVYPQAEVLYQQLRAVRANDEVARVLAVQRPAVGEIAA